MTVACVTCGSGRALRGCAGNAHLLYCRGSACSARHFERHAAYHGYRACSAARVVRGLFAVCPYRAAAWTHLGDAAGVDARWDFIHAQTAHYTGDSSGLRRTTAGGDARDARRRRASLAALAEEGGNIAAAQGALMKTWTLARTAGCGARSACAYILPSPASPGISCARWHLAREQGARLFLLLAALLLHSEHARDVGRRGRQLPSLYGEGKTTLQARRASSGAPCSVGARRGCCWRDGA